ncbi:MAG TPA: hypothetical protein VI504_11325 [Candidatus Eisenbacteria bacterium]|jgi:hypothetical protein
MRHLPGSLICAALLHALAWTSCGAQVWVKVGNTVQHATCLVADLDGTLYCCGDRGLRRSTNSGVTWTVVRADSVSDPFFAPVAYDLAIGSGGRMLLGVNSPNPELALSLDHGVTWRICTPPVGYFACPTSLLVAPGGDLYSLCGGVSTPASGIYRSQDDGITWQRFALGADTTARLGEIGLGPDGELFALEGDDVASSPYSLYTLAPGGSVWTRSVLPGPTASGRYWQRDLWIGSGGRVVVGMLHGIARSVDGGGTWTTGDVSATGGTAFTAIIGDDSGVLFAAHDAITSRGCMVSMDSGNDWTDCSTSLNQAPPLSYRVLARHDNDLYTVNDWGEVYRRALPVLAVSELEPARLAAPEFAPNPARIGSVLHVHLPEGGGSFELFDALGRRVRTPPTSDVRDIVLETARWQPGLYLARTRSPAHTSSTTRLLVLR